MHACAADAFFAVDAVRLPDAAMPVRTATAQDAASIVALHKAANPFGDWYRNPFLRKDPTAYEDLTPFERYLHGGFRMDLGLFRRHFHEYKRRGFPVLVAEERGRVVGECEIWLGEEPAPFGKYAEVETLATSNDESETALLQAAHARARKLGYSGLDLAPRHSGGASAAVDLPFEEMWDTRTFETDVGSIEGPDGEFATTFLAGDYGPLADLLALNHREPARWRFETLSAQWPAAQISDLPDAQTFVGLAVKAKGTDFAILGVRRRWEPGVAEIDVSVPPKALKRPSGIRRVFVIAAEVARRLKAARIRTFAPKGVAKALKAAKFEGGEEPDPWLRWRA